jgi:cytochrome c oxidase assembly protein subunit 15
VASGLSHRVSVAPERLMTHLGLALALFVLLIWTALDAWSGKPRTAERGGWPKVGMIFLVAVFVQSLLGALVAGNDAGLVYNDWPLMNGKLFPREYFGSGVWATIAHSAAAVQLHHRLGAYLLFVAAIVLAAVASRTRHLAEETRILAIALAAGVILQAGLGVATLMAVAPLWLSILHQIGAALLLALATAFAWRIRRV